ncbi:MAG: ferredoxin [Chlorobiaceae bacterium]|nr:ferredoxin [Chlorobiaceae bacterium]NTW73681.1 ferredoxin [Chlorobiaceae bacterium]
MANSEMKHSANAAGPFYVTQPDDPGGQGCTACTICYSAAPEFFSEDIEGYAYVSYQPETQAEIEVCREQMAACPPNAIGDDG